MVSEATYFATHGSSLPASLEAASTMSAQPCDNRPTNRASTDDGVEMGDVNPNRAQPETAGAEPTSMVVILTSLLL